MTATAYGLSTQHGEDWRKRAVCRKEDPEIWFPVGHTGPALAQTEMAKALCRTCPVLEECAEWALSAHEEWGIAAAMTPAERRGIRTGRRARPERPAVRCQRQRHWLTPENTGLDRKGAKCCLTCKAENGRARTNRLARLGKVVQP